MNVSPYEAQVTKDQAILSTAANKPDGRRERGLMRQRALIEAGRDLFRLHGYRGLTLEALIARAGGSRETVYRAFGGKSGLVSAIIAQDGERLAASIVTPVALSSPPREGLMRFGLQLVEVWNSEEGRAINRAVVSEGLDAPDLIDAWYKGAVKLSIDALAIYLDAQVAAGRLKAHDSRLVARQFVILLMGELAFPLVSGSEEARDARLQIGRCLDLIMAAYEADSGGGET